MAALESLITSLTLGSLLGWPYLRRLGHARRHRAFLRTLDDDVQIALHVANHEAQSRGQTLAPVHLLYGLLQVEAFTGAIDRLGASAAPIEGRVHAELARRGDADEQRAALIALGSASVHASHAGRQASCTDLWRYLVRGEVTRLVEPEVSPLALLFLLAHGHLEPSTSLAHASEVFVVIRNDDYTTMQLVTEILRDVFDRSEAEAHAIMRAAHEQGRAIVGRFAGDRAREKIEAARVRARAQSSPLWVGVEPA